MRAGLIASFVLIAWFTMAQTAPPQTAVVKLEKAWSILDAALKDKSADKRAKAVRALGAIQKDSRAEKLVETALADPQPVVRVAAANALGNLHAKAALPALRNALQDKDTEVVFAAADALTEMDDPAAYQLYYGVLTGERKSGHGLLVDQTKMLKDRKHWAEMGIERGVGAVPFGGWGYSAVRTLTQDDVSPVRAEAAAQLASDPDPNSGEALVKAAHDKSWMVRTAALMAIAKRGDTKLLPRIADCLDDQKDAAQYAAAAAIIRLSALAPKSARKRAAAVRKGQ